MRDLQVSIGEYYRCSEGPGVEADVLAMPLRRSISFPQVLNELLQKRTSGAAEYRAIFQPPANLRAGTRLVASRNLRPLATMRGQQASMTAPDASTRRNSLVATERDAGYTARS